MLVGTASAAHLNEVAGYFAAPPPESVLISLEALLAETAESDQ